MSEPENLQETIIHGLEFASESLIKKINKQPCKNSTESHDSEEVCSTVLHSGSGNIIHCSHDSISEDQSLVESGNLIGKREITETFALSETVEPYRLFTDGMPPSKTEPANGAYLEEKEHRVDLEMQDMTPSGRVRKKQGLNYRLKAQEVEISQIIYPTIVEACKLMPEALPKVDARIKDGKITIQEGLSTITLSYSDQFAQPLLQGLDVLSPKGFSILKKLAFKQNKMLKAKLHELLSINKNGKSAKIQLLTQELAKKLCEVRVSDQPLIWFLKESVNMFAQDFRSACLRLNSCTEKLKLSQILLDLLEAAQKNVPAVKAFLNHIHILICRIRNKLDTNAQAHCEERLQLDFAEEVIHDACRIYQNCFGENPLAFNDRFWNQRDSFTGGGLILYIQDERPFLAAMTHQYPKSRLQSDFHEPVSANLISKGSYTSPQAGWCFSLDEEL